MILYAGKDVSIRNKDIFTVKRDRDVTGDSLTTLPNSQNAITEKKFCLGTQLLRDEERLKVSKVKHLLFIQT